MNKHNNNNMLLFFTLRWIFFIAVISMIVPFAFSQQTGGSSLLRLSDEFGNTENTGKEFLNDSMYWIEQIPYRTQHSRTYKNTKGELITEQSYYPLNYINENGEWIPIDVRLYPAANGWAATTQQYPVYFNSDGSTALTTSKNQHIIFNKNCEINGQKIVTGNRQVQDMEVHLLSVQKNIDKKIIFRENEVETDYIIHSPDVLTGSENLVVSEEIDLPSGYFITKDTVHNKNNFRAEDYVVYSQERKEKARFRRPVFFDSNREAPAFTAGTYHLNYSNNKYRLEIIVPAAWMKDTSRIYPVIIDPIVIGDSALWPKDTIKSCFKPNKEKVSLTITVPAGVTITKFIVNDSYYANPATKSKKKQGRLYYQTSCWPLMNYVWTVDSFPQSDSAGTGYIDHQDMKDPLACCLAPVCTSRTFVLDRYLERDSGGTGCNAQYIFYEPKNTKWPFKAFTVGKTVESADSLWSVSPSSLCSDSCTLTLNVTANFGVPPYTITHPWMTGNKKTGSHRTDSCTSTGKTSLSLSIAGCPATCGSITTLSVPPPVITDACGNTVPGLTPKKITINPLPVVTATPVSMKICNKDTVKIALSSCVSGTTFTWTGSNGSGGTGNTISDVPVNSGSVSVVVNYTATPVANGCTGKAITIPVTVNKANIDVLPSAPAVCLGDKVILNATGALTYAWSPPSGLDKTDTSTVSASPFSTTTYIVSGKDSANCTVTDTVKVTVNTLPSLSISPGISICRRDTTLLTAGGAIKYNWAPKTGLNDSTIDTPSAFPDTSTVYVVTGTDNNGCRDTDSVLVTVKKIPLTVSNDTTVCEGETVQLNAQGAVTYQWFPVQNLSNDTVPAPVASPDSSTAYIVKAGNGICVDYDTVFITVDTLTAYAAISPDSSGFVPFTVSFHNSSTGASSYQWFFGDSAKSDLPEPSHTYTSSGNFKVVLVAHTGQCTDTFFIVLDVNAQSALWIPSAFSPNKDGVNDVFMIGTEGILEFRAFVFNRWGQLLHEWDNPENGWDGKYKSEDVPEGIYVLLVKASGADKVKYNKTGSIAVLR